MQITHTEAKTTIIDPKTGKPVEEQKKQQEEVNNNVDSKKANSGKDRDR